MWDEGSVIEKCKVFCKNPNVLGLKSPITRVGQGMHKGKASHLKAQHPYENSIC
jgi:hypothetical protein